MLFKDVDTPLLINAQNWMLIKVQDAEKSGYHHVYCIRSYRMKTWSEYGILFSRSSTFFRSPSHLEGRKTKETSIQRSSYQSLICLLLVLSKCVQQLTRERKIIVILERLKRLEQRFNRKQEHRFHMIVLHYICYTKKLHLVLNVLLLLFKNVIIYFWENVLHVH